MKIRRGVKAIIFDFSPKGDLVFLILHRVLNWKGWEFLKGGIEEGESEEDTLRREIKEEVGLEKVEIIKKIGKIEYVVGETKYIHSCYLVKANCNDKIKLQEKPKEHDSYKWATFDEAMKKLTFDTDKEMLKKAKRLIEALKTS